MGVHKEALHCRSRHDELEVVRDALWFRVCGRSEGRPSSLLISELTVLRGRACRRLSAVFSAITERWGRTAQDDPRAAVQLRERKIQDLAADVIKIHIQLRRRRSEVCAKARALVVDGLVDAELALEPRALFGPAGDRDDARASTLRKLTHDVAGRARGA